MADKKFLGKIHGEPWDALAKGPREALATIWNSYLAEVLQVSPKSARYKIMRRKSRRLRVSKRSLRTGTPCLPSPGPLPGAA